MSRRSRAVRAAASTLNRLELTNNQPGSRYHKIVADHQAIEELLLALGVGTLDKDTAEVIVDLDVTGNGLVRRGVVRSVSAAATGGATC